MKQTQKALDAKNVKITVTEKAKEFIVDNGTDLSYGARPLRRALQRLVEDELTDLIISGELKDGMEVLIDVKDEKLQPKIENKNNEKKKIKNKKTMFSKSPENELSFSF